jgi:hypothetical protein
MATKTSLISAVNGFLTAIITQLKVRNAQLEVINEIYPTVITDNSTTETYTEQTNTDIAYSVNIIKTGKNIRIDGNYQNQTTSALPSNSVIYTQKTNEFKGISDSVKSIGINAVYLDGVLYTTAPMGADEQKDFSITYTAKD